MTIVMLKVNKKPSRFRSNQEFDLIYRVATNVAVVALRQRANQRSPTQAMNSMRESSARRTKPVSSKTTADSLKR